jgi:DNA-binding MarR family transcriptional regulator
MTPTDDDYERLLAFRTGLRRFLAWSEEQALAEGITAGQHQLLLAVRGSIRGAQQPQGPTMGALSDALVIAPHSAVGLVDRAAAAGLVERFADPEDRRVVRVGLTPRGEEVLARLSAQHLAELERLAPAIASLSRPPARR